MAAEKKGGRRRRRLYIIIPEDGRRCSLLPTIAAEIMASPTASELHRVPVEYIEIHVREDPIHPPPLTVLPEGPLAVSPGPFLLQIVRHPQWIVVKIILQELPVEIDIGINNRKYMIIFLYGLQPLLCSLPELLDGTP